MTTPKPVGAVHKWVITIVGGIIVGIVGAIIIGALHLNQATTPNPPVKHQPLTLTVTANQLRANAPEQVIATVQGGTPNNAAQFDLIAPDGAIPLSAGELLDGQGAANLDLDFTTVRRPLQPGTWVVSVVDRGSGISARLTIQVT